MDAIRNVVHVFPLRMKYYHFGDPLTFHLETTIMSKFTFAKGLVYTGL